MTDQPLQPEVPLEIRKPCPKSWGELIGDGKQRFCDACSLHVHDAAQLTRDEASDLVASAGERVCMRIQYDPSGAPLFLDSEPARSPGASARKQPALRLVRWALSAAAGVLAACHGSVSTPAAEDPATAGNGAPHSRMGQVCAPELLGDVAVPPTPVPELLGEVSAVPDPTPEPTGTMPVDAESTRESGGNDQRSR